MGFWSNIFGKKETQGSSAGWRPLLSTQEGARRGTPELLAAVAASPWLFQVTSKIAEHVASIPWILYVRKVGGKPASSRSLRNAGFAERQKAVARSERLRLAQSRGSTKATEDLSADELVVVGDDHPFYTLMDVPNRQLTGLQFRKLESFYQDLKGDWFWRLRLNTKTGLPESILVIPPHWVNRLPSDAKPSYEIQSGGRTETVPENEVVWFKSPNPADPYGRGMGGGDALSDEIDTDQYVAKFIKSKLLNRGMPDAMISVDGAGADEIDRLASEFRDQHRGPWKAGGIHVATSNIKVEKLSQTFEEMGVNELRTWEREAFGSLYGVPPEILGLLSNSNRATAMEARRIFATEVIVPRMEMRRDILQHRLIGAWDERLVLGYENPLPDDLDYNRETAAKVPWIATRGEWRQWVGLEDRGNVDDVHAVPLGTQFLRPDETPVTSRPEFGAPPAPETPAPKPPEDTPEDSGEDTGDGKSSRFRIHAI